MYTSSLHIITILYIFLHHNFLKDFTTIYVHISILYTLLVMNSNQTLAIKVSKNSI